MVRLPPAEGFAQFLVPLQTVQRAELLWGHPCLQASDAVLLRVDDLNVVRHVGRLLDGGRALRPLELEDDGDLIGLIWKMILLSGRGTVCIAKVKGVGVSDCDGTTRARSWQWQRKSWNSYFRQ